MDIVNLQILAIISVLTTLTTECIKTFCKKVEMPYISNVVAAIVSVVLSGVICVVYPVVMTGAVLTPQLIFTAVVMAFFGVLCATLGYQKVIETLKQIGEK